MRSLFVVLLLVLATPALAESRDDRVTQQTGKPFGSYVEALTRAITANGFNIVGIACATCAIQNTFNETVPGNRVFLFFRPDYAQRMLRAGTEAGIEAPIRLYVTEAGDGTAHVSYRLPSAIFGAYGSDALKALGTELDADVSLILRTAETGG